MTQDLDRRVTAARVPIADDWHHQHVATHCAECGDRLRTDLERVWSRETCFRCAADINRRAQYDGLEVE